MTLHSLLQISETMLKDMQGQWQQQGSSSKQQAASMHPKKIYASMLHVFMEIEIKQLSSHPPQLLFWSFFEFFYKK